MGNQDSFARSRRMRVLLAAGRHFEEGTSFPPSVDGAGNSSRRCAIRPWFAGCCSFVGTAKGVENRLVPEAAFPLELIAVSALARAVRRGAACGIFWRCRAPCGRLSNILQKFQPEVILGVGGYAAGPVMLAAALAGIPLAVLEPNAFPGMANRWVAPYVARAFLAFPETASFFRPSTPWSWEFRCAESSFEIAPARCTWAVLYRPDFRRQPGRQDFESRCD